MTHSTYPRIMQPDGHYWQHVRVLNPEGRYVGLGLYRSRHDTVTIGERTTVAWENTDDPDVVRLTK